MVFLALIYLLFFAAQIALGQDAVAPVQEIALMPDCYNVQEVFLTWGWFGKIAAGVVAALAALRPISIGLLNASTLLGPRVALAGRVLYAAGQIAGAFCISKPDFAGKFPKPTKPEQKSEPQPEPPKAA